MATERNFVMKTNSAVFSGRFMLPTIVLALLLLSATAAAQSANINTDRTANISGAVSTAEARHEVDVNAKLKIRSGAFFLEKPALLAVRNKLLTAASAVDNPVVLGTTNPGDYLVFNAGATERARIATNGFVGIGTNTPQVMLDTWTAARGTAYSAANLTTWADQLIKNPTNTIGAATGIAFQLADSYHPNAGTGIAAVRSGNDYQTDLAFITRPYQAVAQERMRISADGKVGIGTTTPQVTFDTWAAARSTSYNPADLTSWADQLIKNPTTASGAATGVAFQLSNSYHPNAGTGIAAVRSDPGNDFQADLAFITRPYQSVAEERMRILSNGNVGIGTVSPSSKLEIASGGRVTLDNPANTNGGGIQVTATSCGTCADVNLFGGGGIGTGLFIQNGGNVGIGTTAPSSKLSVDASTPVNASVAQFINSSIGVGNSLDVSVGKARGSATSFLLEYIHDTNSAVRALDIHAYETYPQLHLLANGNVGIGTPSPGQKLDVVGNINVSGSDAGNITLTGTINAKYQDVAEWVHASEPLSVGTVVVLDSTKSNQVTSSTVSYDTRVAGVISEQPGIALGEKSEGKVLVATTGRVRVKVDATKGPIHIGDLLVTSDVPGVAMKSEPVNLNGVQLHRPGTLIGKALEPLEKGKGEILVLLSLQ
jgi:hypothetical protein